MKSRICLLGKCGSGKGLISDMLVRKIKEIKYYSVGQLLREKANQDSHIKSIHAQGGLVDSNKVLDIFEEALDNESFLLDGSPRRPEEAEFILNHPKWIENPGVLLYLKASDDVVKERLFSRQRFDDDPILVEKRLANFEEITLQSINLFYEKGRVIEIDADKDSEIVFKECMEKLNGYN